MICAFAQTEMIKAADRPNIRPICLATFGGPAIMILLFYIANPCLL